MANPFLNCPPLPSPTQVQVLTLQSNQGWGPSTGSLVLACGGATLGPLGAQTLLFDLQNALNLAFPGAVAMGTNGTPGIPGSPATPGTPAVITVQFLQDPGIPITQVSNSLVDGSAAPVSLTIANNPGVLYPNYTYLTTRWPEFIVPGATYQQLTVLEQQLMALKQDAWRYVQPQNWGGFCDSAVKSGGAFVRATFLMMAHLKKLGKDPVGFVTDQQAKNLRESYSDDKWMAGTVYGQEFIRLRNATILTMRFIPASGGRGGAFAERNNGFEGPSDTWYQPIN